MAQTVFGPARSSAALPFPGSRPKNLGLGRETAAPFRPPPARSVRATRAPSDEIRRSTPRAPRLKRPLGRDPPRTLAHFSPFLLFLLPAAASDASDAGRRRAALSALPARRKEVAPPSSARRSCVPRTRARSFVKRCSTVP